jgi:hypothetical protein
MRVSMVNKSNVAVVRAVTKLLALWSLTEAQEIAILGFESNAELNDLVNVPSRLHLSPDLELRLSIILNIHEELRLLFSNPVNIYGYMTMANNNSPFKGQKPIEIASQNLDGLNIVYQAISSIRNND